MIKTISTLNVLRKILTKTISNFRPLHAWNERRVSTTAQVAGGCKANHATRVAWQLNGQVSLTSFVRLKVHFAANENSNA